MSDLLGAGGSGRASNGGARSASGPTPVSQSQAPAPSQQMLTPRDVWNSRQAREARRREQQETLARQTEQREQQAQEEETRRTAERRTQAAGVAAQGRTGTGMARMTGESGYGTDPSRIHSGGGASGYQGSSTARQQDSQAATGSRTRASSVSQNQPRPAQAVASGAPTSRVPGTLPRLPTTSAPQQPHTRTASAPAQTIPTSKPPTETTQPQPQTRSSNVSSFPHAFERWESLSSHWEGLTSYWIRRLENNREEVRREPLAQQMSRQITDLSAAGANLFHAVVELQRLRASSERKFQRWFFETRQEQERMGEVHAELERALATERAARQEAEQRAERAERDKNVDNKKTIEMQRELQISKEEARRAWEELGRREQEERDRTMSLRDGLPTLVGGVQVVPMQQASARQTHLQQSQASQDLASDPQLRQEYSYDDQSPTDTDPYASTAARAATTALRHDPEAPAVSRGGQASYTSTTGPPTSAIIPTSGPVTSAPSAATRPAGPTSAPGSQAPRFDGPSVPMTEPSTPEAFYTHGGAYIGTQGGQAQTQQAPQSAVSEPDDSHSYIPSVEGESEISDEEYEIDAHGNYVRDARGNPVPYRPPRRSTESDNDSYDVRAELAHEQELAQRYGGQRYPVTTSAAAAGPSSAYAGQPDYEGQGYGGREYEWAGVQRHHHPTRLSDVLEEDERSRTSPSRNSQRGGADRFGGTLG